MQTLRRRKPRRPTYHGLTVLVLAVIGSLASSACGARQPLQVARPMQTAQSSKEATASSLPRIVILATGGTIAGQQASAGEAGYKAGQLPIDALLSAVPELRDKAVMSGEQIAQVGSQDMNDTVWLALEHRVLAPLKIRVVMRPPDNHDEAHQVQVPR